MGEIAEAMLDGTLCAGCGVYLDQEPLGFPVYCDGCTYDIVPRASPQKQAPGKQRCPICGARKADVEMHAKAKHPSKWKEVMNGED